MGPGTLPPLTQPNSTPHRLGLFASLTLTSNPYLTFHNDIIHIQNNILPPILLSILI